MDAAQTPLSVRQFWSRKKKPDPMSADLEFSTFPTCFSSVLKNDPPIRTASISQSPRKFGQPTAARAKAMVHVFPVEPEHPTFLSCDIRNKQITVHNNWAGGKQETDGPKSFSFDAVFPQESSLAEVCSSSLRELLKAILQGSNGCIYCYGHAGLGKTYTMLGIDDSSENLGIIPCAISWLYDMISEQVEKTDSKFSVRVSAIEVTGKQVIHDLLIGKANPKDVAPMIHFTEDPMDSVRIENQTELRAPTALHAACYLDAAIAARTVPGTAEDCSAMHFRFTLHVYQYNIGQANQNHNKVIGGRSQLHFLDLGNCSNEGKEGFSISNLGMVLLSTLTGSRHIPHKENYVTQLIRESMGSVSCHTCMIAHISPSIYSFDETLQVLQLASRIHRLRSNKKVKLSSTSSDESSHEEYPSSRQMHSSFYLRAAEGRSSSDPEYVSSSEQSCDTVIYVGKGRQRFRNQVDGSHQTSPSTSCVHENCSKLGDNSSTVDDQPPKADQPSVGTSQPSLDSVTRRLPCKNQINEGQGSSLTSQTASRKDGRVILPPFCDLEQGESKSNHNNSTTKPVDTSEKISSFRHNPLGNESYQQFKETSVSRSIASLHEKEVTHPSNSLESVYCRIRKGKLQRLCPVPGSLLKQKELWVDGPNIATGHHKSQNSGNCADAKKNISVIRLNPGLENSLQVVENSVQPLTGVQTKSTAFYNLRCSKENTDGFSTETQMLHLKEMVSPSDNILQQTTKMETQSSGFRMQDEGAGELASKETPSSVPFLSQVEQINELCKDSFNSIIEPQNVKPRTDSLDLQMSSFSAIDLEYCQYQKPGNDLSNSLLQSGRSKRPTTYVNSHSSFTDPSVRNCANAFLQQKCLLREFPVAEADFTEKRQCSKSKLSAVWTCSTRNTHKTNARLAANLQESDLDLGDRTVNWVKNVQETTASRFVQLLHSRKELFRSFRANRNDQNISKESTVDLIQGCKLLATFDQPINANNCDDGGSSPPPAYESPPSGANSVLDINENEACIQKLENRSCQPRSAHIKVKTSPKKVHEGCNMSRTECALQESGSGRKVNIKRTHAAEKKQFSDCLLGRLLFCGQSVITKDSEDGATILQCTKRGGASGNGTEDSRNYVACSAESSIVGRLSQPDGASNPNIVHKLNEPVKTNTQQVQFLISPKQLFTGKSIKIPNELPSGQQESKQMFQLCTKRTPLQEHYRGLVDTFPAHSAMSFSDAMHLDTTFHSFSEVRQCSESVICDAPVSFPSFSGDAVSFPHSVSQLFEQKSSVCEVPNSQSLPWCTECNMENLSVTKTYSLDTINCKLKHDVIFPSFSPHLGFSVMNSSPNLSISNQAKKSSSNEETANTKSTGCCQVSSMDCTALSNTKCIYGYSDIFRTDITPSVIPCHSDQMNGVFFPVSLSGMISKNVIKVYTEKTSAKTKEVQHDDDDNLDHCSDDYDEATWIPKSCKNLTLSKSIHDVEHLLCSQDRLKQELAAAKDMLMIDRSCWNFDLHVAEQMNYGDPSYLEALKQETAILEKRVNACKSRIMFITVFDITS